MHGTFAQKQRYVNGLYYVLASSAACVDKNTVKVFVVSFLMVRPWTLYSELRILRSSSSSL